MKHLIHHIKKLIKLDFRYGWSGNYKNWEEARSKTKGYDSNVILQKVKDATLKVKNGEAVYERDSVLFDKVQYSWPLLSVLMWVAAKKNGHLSVIDFGGSLGSTYFQNRRFLTELQEVKWNVVEQQSFVDCGNKYVSDSTIQFFRSVKQVIDKQGLPDLLLISCTLPYLEKPYEFLHEITNYKIPYLLIDSTPFNYQQHNRITIQKIHPAIYEASYPCWFLDYATVKGAIQQQYQIIEEYQNELYIYLDGEKIIYRGLLAELNK